MIAFLSPLFLAGALAAAVPIVLHLLKRDPEVRMKFSAVRMLRHAPVERASHRRLRELLLLALRVAALVLLALAFARPFLPSQSAAAASRATIVALDGSLSMSAPGQMDKARQLARAAIDRAARGDAVGVIVFADDARTVAALSIDRQAAMAAIDGASAGVGSTRYRVGLNAASDLLGGRAGTIVVVTDLLENGWDAGDRAGVPESVAVEVADVGAAPADLAVTSARAAGDRVVASIRNTAAQPREARVTLASGDGPTDTARADLRGETTIAVGPNQSVDVGFPRPQGAWASVSVADPQGVEGDNTRFAILGDAARRAVLVVSASGDLARDGFYVQQALMATASGDVPYVVESVAGFDLGSWNQERLEGYAAAVVTATKGLDRRARELLSTFVQRGGGVFIASGADVDGDLLPELLGGAKVTSTPPPASGPRQSRSLAPADARHPILRAFGAGVSSLGLVRFERIAGLRAPECQVLARFTTGEPAAVDCGVGEGRAIVFASDLDNRGNDFPLHPTFVPFVHESVRYVTASRRTAPEYLVGSVPSGVPPVPGVASIAAAQSGTRLVAVNVDPAEATERRLSVEEFQTAVTRLKDVAAGERRLEIRDQEERQHIWKYVLALMMAMLVVETLVARRTV